MDGALLIFDQLVAGFSRAISVGAGHSHGTASGS